MYTGDQTNGARPRAPDMAETSTTIILGGPTGVNSSKVTIQNQWQTEQAALQRCNSFCGPLQPYQLCTPTEQPNIGIDIKDKARF